MVTKTFEHNFRKYLNFSLNNNQTVKYLRFAKLNSKKYFQYIIIGLR